MKTTVTLRDIARRAHVSHVTVSNVLNRPGHEREVSKRKATRIRQLAGQMGYVPNHAAQHLRLQKTHCILLATSAGLLHPYVHELVEELHVALDARAYQLNLELIYRVPDPKAVYRTFTPSRYDGVIMLGKPPGAEECLLRIRKTGLAFVLIDHEMVPDCNCVHYNLIEAIYLGTRHLLQQGHRRIALVYDANDGVSRQKRLQGYDDALKEFGLNLDERLLIRYPVPNAKPKELWSRIVESQPRPTAIVCYNEELAAGLLPVICEEGLRVPDDIALVTQGNSRLTTLAAVPLTAVDNNNPAIAEAVVACLLEHIENPKAPLKQVLVKPILVIRASSNKCPKR